MFGDWPWDGTAALFVVTEIKGNIRRLQGWKAWPIGDRAVHFNGSARSHFIKKNTINLVLARLGLNCPVTEKRLRFVACIFLE
jgi:hypothetical protein